MNKEEKEIDWIEIKNNFLLDIIKKRYEDKDKKASEYKIEMNILYGQIGIGKSFFNFPTSAQILSDKRKKKIENSVRINK